MPGSREPKIFYNDEYFDFRTSSKSSVDAGQTPRKKQSKTALSRPNPINVDENKVVNTALKQLAKSYTYTANFTKSDIDKLRTVRKSSRTCRKFSGQSESFKSKSQLVPPIKPVLNAPPNIDGLKNHLVSPTRESVTKKQKSEITKQTRDKSLERLFSNLNTEKPSVETYQSTRKPIWKDQRLANKYSILKVPWKRSYTLPICSPQISEWRKFESIQSKLDDYTDKRTYLYDDGSDIDSMFYTEPKRRNFSQTMQYLFIDVTVYLCAFSILSALVWFITGNKWIYKLLMPELPEQPVKKYAKYIGGGVIYTISSILKLIGRLFVVPTQQLFTSVAENWQAPT